MLFIEKHVYVAKKKISKKSLPNNICFQLPALSKKTARSTRLFLYIYRYVGQKRLRNAEYKFKFVV